MEAFLQKKLSVEKIKDSGAPWLTAGGVGLLFVAESQQELCSRNSATTMKSGPEKDFRDGAKDLRCGGDFAEA